MSAPKRKRRESWGSIRRLPSGAYQASYVVDGRRYNGPVTFNTITLAREYLAREHAALQTGTWQSPDARKAARVRSDLTFAEYAETVLSRRTTKNGDALRPGTRDSYRRLLVGPLAPFADRQVAAITRADVKNWHGGILAAGHKTTASMAYILLKGVMAEAVEDGLIEENPVNVKHAGTQSTGKRVEPPTRDELAIMADAIDPRCRVLLLVSAWCGLRFGEATALTRSDVQVGQDADGPLVVLSITKSVVHVTGQTEGIVGPTKTRNTRQVVVPQIVVPDLLAHLDWVGRFPKSLVFPALTGEHHLRQTSLFPIWRKARLAAGRDDCPWHALRHFGVTQFAATGAPMADVLERFGHSAIPTSLRYQHATEKGAQLARDLA